MARTPTKQRYDLADLVVLAYPEGIQTASVTDTPVFHPARDYHDNDLRIDPSNGTWSYKDWKNNPIGNSHPDANEPDFGYVMGVYDLSNIEHANEAAFTLHRTGQTNGILLMRRPSADSPAVGEDRLSNTDRWNAIYSELDD